MKIEELKKLVVHELEWLTYYANLESKEKLNNESSIYNQLISIGYTKRVIPLVSRCSAGVIKITDDRFEMVKEQTRNIENSLYTPLETWIKLYPDSFIEVKKYLLREENKFI